MIRIPVLTYHATNISGNEYQNNDHIAFAADLGLIEKLNIQILSSYDLIDWYNNKLALSSEQNYVVLTFDDGSELDYMDWHHPNFGQQKSFYNIMKDYGASIHATSFVIASPVARRQLQQTCLAGYEIWGDDWWQEVEESGLISIENHSWDHLHPTLDRVANSKNLKGDFSIIDNLDDAHLQIKQSSNYINSQIKNKKTRLFAYPYGDYNEYLVEDYFKHQQTEIKAAFTCESSYVDSSSSVFKIPRFVCGSDWKSLSGLEKILLKLI